MFISDYHSKSDAFLVCVITAKIKCLLCLIRHYYFVDDDARKSAQTAFSLHASHGTFLLYDSFELKLLAEKIKRTGTHNKVERMLQFFIT